jgi:hypothetical protein
MLMRHQQLTQFASVTNPDHRASKYTLCKRANLTVDQAMCDAEHPMYMATADKEAWAPKPPC